MPRRSGGRVRERRYRRSLPSEPYMKVSPHTAQAFANAPLGSRTSKPFGCRLICIAPLAGWPGSLVTEDLGEVCRLSPRGDVADAQPLSAPLQGGVRLLPHPLPAAPTGRLATSLPQRAGLR